MTAVSLPVLVCVTASGTSLRSVSGTSFADVCCAGSFSFEVVLGISFFAPSFEGVLGMSFFGPSFEELLGRSIEEALGTTLAGPCGASFEEVRGTSFGGGFTVCAAVGEREMAVA
jgi:hypothetical protein